MVYVSAGIRCFNCALTSLECVLDVSQVGSLPRAAMTMAKARGKTQTASIRAKSVIAN